MLRPGIIAAAFVLGLLAPLSASGQQATVQPTHLALEVYYFGSEPPAYVAVQPANSSPSGSWFARFKRVPGWTAAAGSLQVTAVNFRPTLDGDSVRVSVSVFLGTRHEEEKGIATYTLREGEKVRVEELAQLGVEPFGLKLVRVTPTVADLPTVVSKPKSIEFVTIQASLSTLPSYRVALRNLSNKNVTAIGLRVMQGGRTLLSGMPQGKEGAPLIPAGGVAEVYSFGATTAAATPGGFDPVEPSNQHIEITMAAFEDGSFEGDVDTAAGFRGFVKGRRIQLRRLIDVFQAVVQNENSNPSGTLGMLRSKVDALGIDADSQAVQEVESEFSAMAEKPTRNLTSAIEAAMNGIRRDAQQTIAQFQLKNPNADASALHAWLVASKEKYAVWLARL